MDEKTGRILASRAVAEPLVDNFIDGLDVYVGRVTSAEELRKGLVHFGFHLTSQTVAYRIKGF
jgi:hypothetical protein